MVRAGNAVNQRRQNSFLLLRLVRDHGPLTRHELSRRLDLAVPSVSNIVEILLERRVLHEITVQGRNNRPVPAYRFNGSAYQTLGIEFRRQEIRLCVADLAGVLSDMQIVPVDAREPEALVDDVLERARRLIQSAESRGERILAAGLGMPGPLDSAHEHLLLTTGGKPWGRVLVRRTLADRLGIPVVFEKNTTMAAYAEWREGDPGADLLYVVMNEGIGAGVVFPEGIFRGGAHFPTEIGHTSVDCTGPICECGNRGCLEVYASYSAVRRAVGSTKGEHRRTALMESGIVPFTAMAVGNACSLTGVRNVVLGGTTIEAFPEIVELLAQEIPRRSFPGSGPLVSVRRGSLGLEASCTGASLIAAEHILFNLEHYLGESSRTNAVTSMIGVV